MNNIKLISFSQKNSKLQFCQSDLLKLLSYLEGELQARDVVIAALKVIFVILNDLLQESKRN